MTTWIDAIGWTLLHFLWQGTLIAAATGAVLLLLRYARPQQRYLVACAGLLLCALWPALQLMLRLDGAMTVHDAYPARTPGAVASGSQALRPYMYWIVAAWSAGNIALALRTALGLVWIGRAVRNGGRDTVWQARLTALARSMGVTRTVRLRIVDGLRGPVTALCWRPVVLMPAALLSGMPPDLLQALLAHEIAHIRRHDYLVNLLQNAIETVLFYHPAVWWLSHRIRRERELIADAIAASHAGGNRRLAQALSELEKRQFTHPEPALAANGGDTMERAALDELSAAIGGLLAEHGIADSDIDSAELAKKTVALSTPAADGATSASVLTRHYRIQVRDLARWPGLVSALLATEHVDSVGVSFDRSDSDQLNRDLMSQAAQDARNNGTLLARSFGRKLGAAMAIARAPLDKVSAPFIAQTGGGAEPPPRTPATPNYAVPPSIPFAQSVTAMFRLQ